MFKILGETPRSGPNLCDTCGHGLVAEGENFEKIIRCLYSTLAPASITFKVTKCSRYHQRGQTSLSDMEKVAWIISTEALGPIGFAGGSEQVERKITIKKPEIVVPTTSDGAAHDAT